jgi:hypothetical protein
MEEIWKDVPGYEGLYQVSNYGNILTLSDRWGKKRLLKPNKNNGNNYYAIDLHLNKKRKRFEIHKLVAMAFLDHKPNGHEMVVNHIDNDKSNNYLNNLELVSTRYNTSCHKKDVGVYWNKQKNKWLAHITINGLQIHLGYSIDKQDALNMYQKALANIHLYNGDNKEFRNKLKTL